MGCTLNMKVEFPARNRCWGGDYIELARSNCVLCWNRSLWRGHDYDSVKNKETLDSLERRQENDY